MLTKNDIELLKEVFATKAEIQHFVTKDEFKKEINSLRKVMKANTDMIVEEFRTAIELIGTAQRGVDDHEKRIQKLESYAFQQTT
ncbi:MAG: hypothetical protein ACEQSA_04080 [Weeksellaceae bacterium]